MAHGGSERVVRTGLLAPIFDVGFYFVLFRVFLKVFNCFGFGVWSIVRLITRISHLASPQVRDPDQRPAGSEAGDLGIAWLSM